jgi:hypothetical protein
MLVYAQGSWTVIQMLYSILFVEESICINDLHTQVTVYYVIVPEVMIGIIDSEHVFFGGMAVDKVTYHAVSTGSFHYQLPSSVHTLMVKNNQPMLTVRELGPAHSSWNRLAQGMIRQCAGLTVIITLAPE